MIRPVVRGLPERPLHSVRSMLLVTALVATAACSDDDPLGPGTPPESSAFILNSTGQTIGAFVVTDSIATGSNVDLGAGFDGQWFDMSESHAVSTVSALGGSQVRFVERASSVVQTVLFPGPDAATVDPGLPTFDADGTAWVGGRGADAVYRASPGDQTATRIASNVGTYVSRVIPVGDRLYAVDSNLDDDGFTFQPLGPSRVVVLDRAGATLRVITLPADAPNAFDAVLVGSRLIILTSGTFDENFMARGDGALVIVDTDDDSVSGPYPLGGNGNAIELGRDGLVYATRTVDYTTIDALVFDPSTASFLRGPDNPLPIRDAGGARVDCWVVSALADGRLLCATFNFAEPGRLVLTDMAGDAISEAASGFGSTDIHVE